VAMAVGQQIFSTENWTSTWAESNYGNR